MSPKLKPLMLGALLLMCNTYAFAIKDKPAPPEPVRMAPPPPPPGLPVDGHLILLLFAGLLFGTYICWKWGLFKKPS